jgi:hypothetical protein
VREEEEGGLERPRLRVIDWRAPCKGSAAAVRHKSAPEFPSQTVIRSARAPAAYSAVRWTGSVAPRGESAQQAPAPLVF